MENADIGHRESRAFTFADIRRQYVKAIELGYSVVACEDYVQLKRENALPGKVIVNRVDIDFSVTKAGRLAGIFSELGIRSTFFLRLHAPEYNPFSFENYRIIKDIVTSGHELGYHSEVVDESVIWNEDAAQCLRRDLEIINRLFAVRICGVASHGGRTGHNNLDFWKENDPAAFGLAYEAYDSRPEFNLFRDSFYVSDSEWTRWKCYDCGTIVPDDRRSLGEHLGDGRPLLYVLIHPDTYYDRHFYE